MESSFISFPSMCDICLLRDAGKRFSADWSRWAGWILNLPPPHLRWSMQRNGCWIPAFFVSFCLNKFHHFLFYFVPPTVAVLIDSGDKRSIMWHHAAPMGRCDALSQRLWSFRFRSSNSHVPTGWPHRLALIQALSSEYLLTWKNTTIPQFS